MITGTVKEIHKKDWKNGIFMYHFLMENSPRVYNCGTSDPQVKEGEHISFKEVNRKVDTSTIQRVSAADAAKAPEPEPPAQRQTDLGLRIQKQQARRDAIRLVCTAMETKLLPFPQSGKAEDKWNRLLDLVNETTTDLLEIEDKWTERSK